MICAMIPDKSSKIGPTFARSGTKASRSRALVASSRFFRSVIDLEAVATIGRGAKPGGPEEEEWGGILVVS